MAFKQVNTSDPILTKIQDNIAQALNDASASPFGAGNLITPPIIQSGIDNLIAHGLQKKPTIWVIVRNDTSSTLWEQASAALGNVSADDTYLNIRTSATCNVVMWIA